MRPSINPFRAKALAVQRYEIAPKALNQLVLKIHRLHYRACIRGPHGTGKSTLLQDLAVALKNQGCRVNGYYLNNQMSKKNKKEVLQLILESHQSHINCLDGGETIGWFSWRWFLLKVRYKNKTLLATTHGLSPLATLYKTQVDQALILAITKRLAGASWSHEMEHLATKTYADYKGNCREVFRACYMYCGGIE